MVMRKSGPIPSALGILLISSSGGGAIAVILLASEATVCADYWFAEFTSGSWVVLTFHVIVLTGLSWIACIALSWLSLDVRGGSVWGAVSAFAVGAAAWAIPSAIILIAAETLGAGECYTAFFRVILIFQCFVVCVGLISIPTLIALAIAAARRRSRTGQ